MARIKADRANWDDTEPFASFIRYHSITNFQSKKSLGKKWKYGYPFRIEKAYMLLWRCFAFRIKELLNE
jgi:hypothetical protein